MDTDGVTKNQSPFTSLAITLESRWSRSGRCRLPI